MNLCVSNTDSIVKISKIVVRIGVNGIKMSWNALTEHGKLQKKVIGELKYKIWWQYD